MQAAILREEGMRIKKDSGARIAHLAHVILARVEVLHTRTRRNGGRHGGGQSVTEVLEIRKIGQRR